MAELKDDGGAGSGSARSKGPLEAATEEGRIASFLAEIDRVLGATADPDRVAGLQAGIGRLLDGFGDQMEAVNRRLDRVLKRRARPWRCPSALP